MIDDLIEKIVKNKSTDDDFIQMTFLVLLGTIIAPVSHEYVPKKYYALVQNIKLIRKFNWNAFTSQFCLSEIGKLLQDGHVRQWPQGNLALLQYLYWEKVQPITGPKYDPLALLSPLMRNWTEDMAVRRDKYDYEYGRGVGMIDDNITEEYMLKTIAEEEAQKTKKASSKKSNTYIPLNKENTHWVTVVMHSEKREFQVLDSLMTGKLDSVIRELVEDLRKQLAEDIQEANATGIVNYPDVSNWPIQMYDMPKQHDGNSCGIFLLRCFQYWDGDKWTGLFSQVRK
ncbi:hypothetical protein VPH35_060643 [Triticum aestivum]